MESLFRLQDDYTLYIEKLSIPEKLFCGKYINVYRILVYINKDSPLMGCALELLTLRKKEDTITDMKLSFNMSFEVSNEKEYHVHQSTGNELLFFR